MTSLRQTGTNGRFLALFRFNGRQFQRALKTTQRKEALAQITRIDDLITLIERGRIEIPSDVDPGDFIVSDGRLAKSRPARELVRLHELFDAYRSALPTGSEGNTNDFRRRIALSQSCSLREVPIATLTWSGSC